VMLVRIMSGVGIGVRRLCHVVFLRVSLLDVSVI